MLTKRAIWMLLTAAMLFVAGVLLRHEPVALVSLALLIWLGMEWLRFRLAIAQTGEWAKSCHRQWDNQELASERIVVLRVDQSVDVRVQLEPASRLHGLRVWLEDVVPPGGQTQGSPRLVSDVWRNRPLHWNYALRVGRLGKLQMPGIEMRVGDAMGLFEHFEFVACRQEINVLPLLVRPQTTVSILKRSDAQTIAGQHRYQRPGGSGELLSIRDYQPGDPPKSIAWKVSARLGRLMSCEYERETPVRSTIITDLSLYQFVGRPGPAAADRAAALTASMARLLLADRDPVANVVVNGEDRSWLPHGHGERQLTRMLHVLLSHVGSHAVPPGIVFEDLADVAWLTCRRRFPSLFDARVNPQRGFVRLTNAGSRLRRRQQLAFALAQIFHEPLVYAHQLQEDRQEFSFACRRFLAAHPTDRIPVDAPAAHQLAVSRHRSLRTICRALMEGVTRAKDNELFMVVAAQPVMLDEIDMWERVVRMARAKLHRVMLLYSDPQPNTLEIEDPDARRILMEDRREAVTQTMADLRSRTMRLGATVAEFDSPNLAQQVAAEIELLGSGRGRKAGTR